MDDTKNDLEKVQKDLRRVTDELNKCTKLLCEILKRWERGECFRLSDELQYWWTDHKGIST